MVAYFMALHWHSLGENWEKPREIFQSQYPAIVTNIQTGFLSIMK